MYHVLVIGAGFVAPALIGFLLRDERVCVNIADKDQQKAAALAAGFLEEKRCIPLGLDVTHKKDLEACVRSNDLIVSLVDAGLHAQVAKACLAMGRDLITTSYPNKEMKLLAEHARERGLIFINEAGLDPGLDHMLAAKQIANIHGEGGLVEALHVYGSCLPALACNTNPLGYKISWSPGGFLAGMQRKAVLIRDGERISIRREDVLKNYVYKEVKGIGVLESYPYGNAAVYKEFYDIPECSAISRNNLRHIGFCESWYYFQMLGLFQDSDVYDFDLVSFADILKRTTGCSADGNLEEHIAAFLGISRFHPVLRKIHWLGLLDHEKMHCHGKITMLGAFRQIIEQKLGYGAGERDMAVLQQEMIWTDRNAVRKKTTSRLILYGDEQRSAVAAGVGAVAAACVGLWMDRRITNRGMMIPVTPEFYKYALPRILSCGLNIEEDTQVLKEKEGDCDKKYIDSQRR